MIQSDGAGMPGSSVQAGGRPPATPCERVR